MAVNASSARALVTLLVLACVMGGNHVAARVAFDHGVGVVTAVASRSLVTALAVGVLLWIYRVPEIGRAHV